MDGVVEEQVEHQIKKIDTNYKQRRSKAVQLTSRNQRKRIDDDTNATIVKQMLR